MEYASGLIKLEAGSEARVEEWRSTIASRLDEAAATLVVAADRVQDPPSDEHLG
jgi:hypothetical protein